VPPTMRPSMAARDARYEHGVVASVGQAYGDAAVSVRRYASPDLYAFLTVVAVRAHSPGLFSTAADPKDLQIARPTEEVVSVGEVQCVVHNDPVPTSQEPRSPVTTVCQRTSGSLTVFAFPSGTLAEKPGGAAAMVRQTWGAVGG
jgi:hypothetical protein